MTLRLCIILLCMTGLLGCRGPNGELEIAKPWYVDMEPPAGAPREYEQGWRDGCSTGADTYSNNLYKMFNTFGLRFDASLKDNKMYTQAWHDAFIYCVLIMEKINNEGL